MMIVLAGSGPADVLKGAAAALAVRQSLVPTGEELDAGAVETQGITKTWTPLLFRFF